MRGYLEMKLSDGGLESFGPYDATNEIEFVKRARYWARTYCRAGKVKVCMIFLGLEPVAAYRTRPNGGYQLARGFRRVGALASPIWRG